ncbi:glycosyltransferase family 57 protein [Amanita thiersii Skay4041]|uniref:Alpha-1,3-glucosyltransferase n=1 Tax=Amanita thiersii Skay4041 TaxID=703135 RepID=A0A2A9P0K8_9AGAR|nr:glycosyltransferase family 57 protein [Amanita thiersii Skay4041]
MHKRGIREWVLPGALLASVLVKLGVGMGSYSGMGTPPMYGDYEAQRHWMELTVHLPIREWYSYDLPYWGLDYPPLTAYVSWLCGIIGTWIEPSWFALGKSRGIETPGSKVFMRSTVVLLDALVYVPALLMFLRIWQGSRSQRTQNNALLTLLFQPALLLIDFGHFQYNSVMLGLTLAAMNCFAMGRDLWGAVFFVLSLGFKQMALYYAPAIGTYLLVKCLYLGRPEGERLFLRLTAVTVSTFILLFLPFLPPFAHLSTLKQSLIRIFPFSRGLFEDKVANFWCATNVLIKWKNWASPDFLVKISTLLTAVGFLPSVVNMFYLGRKMQLAKSAAADTANNNSTAQPPFLALLPYALLASSMSFFLFSFQVHEKTILLPLMPMMLLLSGAQIDSPAYMWGALLNNTAVFSMWPLLKRDGLGLQYVATLVLWNRLIGYNPFRWPPKTLVHILSQGVFVAAFGLHLLEFVVTPPKRYPDLFPVLNVLVCTPVFLLGWLWAIKCGVEVGWALGGVGPVSAKAASANTEDTGSAPMGEKGRKEGERENGMSSGRRWNRAGSVEYSQTRRRGMAEGMEEEE